MNQENNAVALDVGKKRIGVATANLGILIASPLTTIEVDGTEFDQIERIISDNGASIIVVGLPRGLEGQDTPQTQYTRKFASKLSGKGHEVHLQDEALTSVNAREELENRKKPYTKHDVDALAATYILEDFLKDHYETN